MTRIGVYGRLSPYSGEYTEEGARIVAESELDFYLLQRAYDYDPLHYQLAKTIKDAGKRIWLRTYFWNKPPFYEAGISTDWTDIRGNDALYDEAVRIISEEIEDWGPENLWGISINEEEPQLAYDRTGRTWHDPETGMAYGWAVDDYLYGHNIIYRQIKALYPDLKIVGTCHPMYYFTDGEVKSLQADGLVAATFRNQDPDFIREYNRRLLRLGREMGFGNNIFTAIFAATTPSDWSNPDGDWQLIRPAFEIAALEVGIPNICLFCNRLDISPGENMFFLDYPPTPIETQTTPEIRRTDPYWHMQTVMELIDEYAAAPSGTKYIVPAIVIVGIILLAIIAGRR